MQRMHLPSRSEHMLKWLTKVSESQPPHKGPCPHAELFISSLFVFFISYRQNKNLPSGFSITLSFSLSLYTLHKYILYLISNLKSFKRRIIYILTQRSGTDPVRCISLTMTRSASPPALIVPFTG